MKKLMMIAAIFTVFSFSAEAQRHSKRGGQDRVDPEKRAEMRANQLADRLDLTEEQKEEVYKIHLERAQERQEMREARREEMKERREAMQEERKEQNEEIEKILTPEQREKWVELRNEERERMDRYRDARGNEDGERLRKRQFRRGGGN
jgi:periplasmic protein CpxP/Spy